MAWIFLVQGYHYSKTTSREKFEKTIAKLEENEKYAEIVQTAKKAGLLVTNNYNYDDDCGDLFFGKELNVGRHIYQGKTLSAQLANNLQPQIEELNEQLSAILKKKDFELVGSGIVLNQFD